MNDQLMAALNERDDQFKGQLEQIGQSMGYGRAIQMLGQLWDDMLQAKYPGAGRHQESMRRRTDIERIEAGLPIARQVVYYQKRGRKGQITSFVPHDFVIENVARIVSDTPLFGRIDKANATSAADPKDAEQTPAARDVLAERRRQITVEGYDPEHDDGHVQGEIAALAAFYAMPPACRDWPAEETGYGATFGIAILPESWAISWPTDDTPIGRRAELVKAGALIQAEIERIDRAGMKNATNEVGGPR